MSSAINFPNLGIHLKHVGRFFHIGSLEIAYYGVCISIAMLLGFTLAIREAKRTKQNPDDYYYLIIFGIVLGIIGARAYYVIFSFDEFKDDLLSIFNIRGGGLAIYGGIIGAVIAVVIWCKKKKQNIFLTLDTISMSLVLGQAIGRLGNFFNREVFGGFTKSLFAMEIPIKAVNDPSDITNKMLDNIVTRKGVEFISVHPTFLYEMLCNLLIFLILMLYRKHKKFDGELFLMYLTGYGIARFFIEMIRTDKLLIPIINFPVSEFVALVTVAVSLSIIISKRINLRKQSIKEKTNEEVI